MVEKDYWVTHSLWALQQSGLSIWFKGGTSLSKGFSLIERFSEDIDVQLEHGTLAGLPEVSSWKSESKTATAARSSFFRSVADRVSVPGAPMAIDEETFDPKRCRAHYRIDYPGIYRDRLPPDLRSFVLLEVGRARVTPFVETDLSSFVHELLQTQGLLGNYLDNRPKGIRCLHPRITLVEKIAAIAECLARGAQPAGYVRHYEDTVRIIRNLENLPELENEVEHVREVISHRFKKGLPSSLLPADEDGRDQLQKAAQKIGPMFWGDRVPLEECAAEALEWLLIQPS